MKSDIRTFVLPAGAVVSKRPMNPEEFSAMNCYEQLQELSYLYLEGVGDNFESDFLPAICSSKAILMPSTTIGIATLKPAWSHS
jgi:hypothetical protein